MESRRHDFDRITTQGRQLSGQCDGQTSSKINEITIRIQQQWTIVERRLQEIIKSSKEIVDNWRQFNSSYLHLLDRLGELEARWYTIQQEKFTSDIDSLFDKAKVNVKNQFNSFIQLFFFRIFNNVFNNSILKLLNFMNMLKNYAIIYLLLLVKRSILNILLLIINILNYKIFKINF